MRNGTVVSMGRLVAIALVAAGVLSGVVGLLFLVGSGGRLYRLGVGVACLAAAGVLAGAGVRLWKRAEARAPARVRADILALAERHDGVVSEGEVDSILQGRAEVGREVLTALLAEGACRRESDGRTTTLTFPGLLPRLVVRRCTFCSIELPLNGPEKVCPQCGGALESTLSSRSA